MPVTITKPPRAAPITDALTTALFKPPKPVNLRVIGFVKPVSLRVIGFGSKPPKCVSLRVIRFVKPVTCSSDNL